MTYHYLGQTRSGAHVAVKACLENKPVAGFSTVEHEPIADATWPEFTMSGAVWDSPRAKLTRDSGADGYGQCIDDARAVTRPSGTLTRKDVLRLVELWERWHLNLMHAACAHMMTLPADPSYDARKGIVCPETGYRYGTAWLAERLPGDVWPEVQSILAKCGPKEINP